MKKILMLFLPVAATVALAAACHDKGELDLGENGVYPVSDRNVSAFFEKHLTGEWSVNSTWFLVDVREHKCLMINSAEEFRDLVPDLILIPTPNSTPPYYDEYSGKNLPSIDFDKYTLVVGQAYGPGDTDCRVTEQGITIGPDTMSVSLIIRDTNTADYHTFSHVPVYFWGIYPKLPNKPIIVNYKF